jgi:hypothetical protein
LEPTLSIFGLLFGLKLLINAETCIGPKGCKLTSQIRWYPFSSLGANTRPLSSAFISNFGQIEEILSSLALTPSVKPLGLNLTFAPIEMLDLG